MQDGVVEDLTSANVSRQEFIMHYEDACQTVSNGPKTKPHFRLPFLIRNLAYTKKSYFSDTPHTQTRDASSKQSRKRRKKGHQIDGLVDSLMREKSRKNRRPQRKPTKVAVRSVEPPLICSISKLPDTPRTDDFATTNGEAKASVNYKLAPRLHFVLHFRYGKNKQKTVLMSDFICPFCARDCLNQIGFLLHIRSIHIRCKYKVTRDKFGSIDVAIKKRKNEFTNDSQETFVTVRSLGTNPKMLTDLIHEDNFEIDSKNEFAKSGTPGNKNRVKRKYHSRTFMPVMGDSASETDEEDIDLLIKEQNKLLHEYSDINSGEKSIMSLWNIYVLKVCGTRTRFCHAEVFKYCHGFLNQYSRMILDANLYRNCVLHFTSLYQYGLLQTSQLQELISKLYENRKVLESAKKSESKHDALANAQELSDNNNLLTTTLIHK
eukprot:m.227280 g.227280  ORF g.227280 m.227280 type:complete len:434 (-) comp15970_c2_seq7:163-1464(-)